jgi:hypothetical protein
VRLRAGLALGDPTGEVVAAWQGKELLRGVYAADGTADARRALARLLPLVRWCRGRGAVAARPNGQTWEAEILAFHSTGAAPTDPPKP